MIPIRRAFLLAAVLSASAPAVFAAPPVAGSVRPNDPGVVSNAPVYEVQWQSAFGRFSSAGTVTMPAWSARKVVFVLNTRSYLAEADVSSGYARPDHPLLPAGSVAAQMATVGTGLMATATLSPVDGSPDGPVRVALAVGYRTLAGKFDGFDQRLSADGTRLFLVPNVASSSRRVSEVVHPGQRSTLVMPMGTDAPGSFAYLVQPVSGL